MVKELDANRTLTAKDQYDRRSKQYASNRNRIAYRRRKLRAADRTDRKQLLAEISQLEREGKRMQCYDKRHPAKFGYVCYADDFVILVNGSRAEAEQVKLQVADKLRSMGLELSPEKTKLTHSRRKILFLGFHIQGRMWEKGVQIKAIFSIPEEKVRRFVTKSGRSVACIKSPKPTRWLVSARFIGVGATTTASLAVHRRSLVVCRISRGGNLRTIWLGNTSRVLRRPSVAANCRNACGP